MKRYLSPSPVRKKDAAVLVHAYRDENLNLKYNILVEVRFSIDSVVSCAAMLQRESPADVVNLEIVYGGQNLVRHGRYCYKL